MLQLPANLDTILGDLIGIQGLNRLSFLGQKHKASRYKYPMLLQRILKCAFLLLQLVDFCAKFRRLLFRICKGRFAPPCGCFYRL